MRLPADVLAGSTGPRLFVSGGGLRPAGGPYGHQLSLHGRPLGLRPAKAEGQTGARTNDRTEGKRDGRPEKLTVELRLFVRSSVPPSVRLRVHPSVRPTTRLKKNNRR